MKTMSVKLEDSVIGEIKKISEILKISYSDFIRSAVKKEIEENQKNFMYRLSNVPYAALEEEKEILELLNNLSDEDLKIVKVENIDL